VTTPDPTPLIPAIDVSAWQGVIDWPAVAASGRRVAFVKASEGASGEHSRDARFRDNALGACDAGIIAIPYHFFTAAPPEEQAHNFLGALTSRRGPTMLDLERSGSPGSDLGARALAWLATVEAALGCAPWVYVGPWFANGNHFSRHPELARHPLLLADPRMVSHPDGETPLPWQAWTGRQTGTASVPGVRGPCDVDVLRAMP
jgi:lysozyme